MLLPVHEVQTDRVSSRAEVTRINPTRVYCLGSKSGVAWFTWQNGAWYDNSGHVLDDGDVPQQFRDDIAKSPVEVLAGGPEVTKVCAIPGCGEKMNASQMEAHLIEHVRNAFQAAGSAVAAEAAGAPPVPSK